MEFEDYKKSAGVPQELINLDAKKVKVLVTDPTGAYASCGQTEDSNDCDPEDTTQGPTRESALIVLRRTLAHYRKQVAAMEHLERVLQHAENGSPFEEMIWGMLQRSPVRRF